MRTTLTLTNNQKHWLCSGGNQKSFLNLILSRYHWENTFILCVVNRNMLDRNVKYVKKVLKYLPACTARGDVWLGGCLIRGVSGPGGLVWGVPGSGGGCLVWRMPASGPGGYPSMQWARPPVNRMTDRHV